MSKDLRELLANTKGDRSYEQFARDCGGTPSAKRLHQLATLPLKNFPDPPTIEGLATGMGVTVTEVVLASARSLGLRVRDLGDVASIDPSGLTDEQTDAVRHVVRAMRTSGQESRHGTPTNQAGGAGAKVHDLPARRRRRRDGPPTADEIEVGIAEGRMAAHRSKDVDEPPDSQS